VCPEWVTGYPIDMAPRFVIQKHDASSLHYDFRLEVDGVLVSWAVPKGLSTDPREKRLAMPTEDHPLAYIDFEGVIGEGNYGAGSVIVWDTGPYENLTRRKDEDVAIADALADGHVAVRLDGKKLQGGWTLQRTASGKDERWLVIKREDEGADRRRDPVSTEPESVLSGSTNEEIAGGARKLARLQQGGA
jgi:DNA ligase D-like protein (predicted 3'-phosphoesterase)